MGPTVTEAPPTPQTLSTKESVPAVDGTSDAPTRSASIQSSSQVPWSYKICSILLVSGIGFGSSWSSGITGAMKTTLKTVDIILTWSESKN